MRPFKWNKTCTVSIPEIDDEHRLIYGIAGELQQAVIASAPPPQVKKILQRLKDTAENHFAYEEHLMRSLRYPIFQWHKQQHNTFRKRAKHFTPGIEAGDAEAGNLFLEFLARWLKDHLALADRMMSAYVRNQQRTNAA